MTFKGWSRWSCACNPGFIGNGLICVEKETGIKPPEFLEETDIEVILTTEFISVPEGLWQYRLWSFQGRDTKSELFLARGN